MLLWQGGCRGCMGGSNLYEFMYMSVYVCYEVNVIMYEWMDTIRDKVSKARLSSHMVLVDW